MSSRPEAVKCYSGVPVWEIFVKIDGGGAAAELIVFTKHVKFVNTITAQTLHSYTHPQTDEEALKSSRQKSIKWSVFKKRFDWTATRRRLKFWASPSYLRRPVKSRTQDRTSGLLNARKPTLPQSHGWFVTFPSLKTWFSRHV